MAVTRNKKRQALASVTEHTFPVAAGAICYEGGLAAINPDGYILPALTSNGSDLFCVGVFDSFSNNEFGQDGDTVCSVREGIFLIRNGTGINEIKNEDLGTACYVIDDDQVTRLPDDSFHAGYVRGFDGDYVAVEVSTSGRMSVGSLVSGPESSTDGEFAVFDGESGKVLKKIPVLYQNGKTIFPNSDGSEPTVCFGYSYNGIRSYGSAANSRFDIYLNSTKAVTVSPNGIHAARGKVFNAGANFTALYGTQSLPSTIDFSSTLQIGCTIVNLIVYSEMAYFILPPGQDQDFVTFLVVNSNGINVSKSSPNQLYLNDRPVLSGITLPDVGTFLECRFLSNVWYCTVKGRAVI